MFPNQSCDNSGTRGGRQLSRHVNNSAGLIGQAKEFIGIPQQEELEFDPLYDQPLYEVEEFDTAQAHNMHNGRFHDHSEQWGHEFNQQMWFDNNNNTDMHNQWAEQFHPEEYNNWIDEFHAQNLQNNSDMKTEFPQAFESFGLERLRNHENPKFRNSKFLKFVDRLKDGDIKLDSQRNEVIEVVPESERWAEQYDQMHLGPVSENWASEFKGENFDMDFSSRWAEEFGSIDWTKYRNEFKDFENAYNEDYSQNNIANYVFAENNPFLGDENAFEKGLRLMNEGLLTEAVLAFEADVQQNETHAEGWKLLGQCNQENENEAQAIRALEKAVELAPDCLDALLMLGVSYTNDLERGKALNYLSRWLQHHPAYGPQVGDYAGEENQLERVVTMFLAAKDLSTMQGGDADIETVLGVLFNISNDYEKAIECFERATSMRTDDPTLWNKLGATQANSCRSQQAIEAYSRALELKPNYVRALANLGISFSNQGMHDEAAQAYLATLSCNPDAKHIWNYLRMSLSSLNRPELVDLTNLEDPNVFREYFDF